MGTSVKILGNPLWELLSSRHFVHTPRKCAHWVPRAKSGTPWMLRRFWSQKYQFQDNYTGPFWDIEVLSFGLAGCILADSGRSNHRWKEEFDLFYLAILILKIQYHTTLNCRTSKGPVGFYIKIIFNYPMFSRSSQYQYLLWAPNVRCFVRCALLRGHLYTEIG